MQNKKLSLIEKILNKPHLIISFLALFIFAGLIGYGKIHRNLFPNSNYPEVAIVIVEGGASAKSMATNIAVPVEEELYTLEIYGDREKGAISHIMANDPSVEVEQIGDVKQFKASAERMIGAIIVAVVLILFTLIAMFNSIKISLMILFSISLTIIGASWTMLILGYHVSMPAMMGFMLLSGIIVNNAILLIHFALEKMEEGMNKTEAMLESIKIRTRPVLMTAFAVSVGMLPVALGSAIGLERLAPLGAVAIGGLIIGTFMTLVFIPIGFIWWVGEERKGE